MNVNAAVNWILLTIATFPKISPPVMSINRMVPISPKVGLRLAKAASRGALAADTSAPESMKAVAGMPSTVQSSACKCPDDPDARMRASFSRTQLALNLARGSLTCKT